MNDQDAFITALITTRHTALTAVAAQAITDPMQHRSPRRIEMQTMHEALAREHMRQLEHEARQHSLRSQLAAANRWRFLERRAHAAYRRHSQRAQRVAQAVAVSR
jgi:hypothetical protein